MALLDQDPTVSLLSSNIYRTSSGWEDNDKAFISDGKTFFDYESSAPGIYTLGCHNGNSPYKFTSMEAAITNSMNLVTRLKPKLRRFYSPTRAFYLKDIVYIILILLIILILYKIIFVSKK